MDPRADYERRLIERRRHIASLDRVNLQISNLRLLVAAVGALLLWLAFVRGTWSPAWAAGAWILFGIVAVVHAKYLERLERARRAELLYRRALERMSGRWAGTGRDGAAFGDGHPYAHDLDLFGRASLFELLNTARTEAGESTLAAWLARGAAMDDVRARQTAVDELRPKVDFREDISVLAAEGEVSRTGALAKWAASPAARFSPAIPALFAASGAIAVVLTVLAALDVVSWSPLILWLLVEGMIAWRWKRSLMRIIAETGKPADDLKILAALAARVEREAFSAPKLVAMQAGLQARTTADVVPAARAIARLERLVSLLESTTHNLFFMPITRALLVPEQLAVAIDRWHQRYGGAVEEWLRTVGELEALFALATYAFERPEDPFPTVTTDHGLFDAVSLRHPLIHGEVAVPNDVCVGGDAPRVIIVSGSNMSGKSTLLRAVGVNVVLALAGAPVRAARLTMSELAIGATLRVDDSLEAGHSRFYNEILRIKSIVDTARHPAPLLFLLDEVLHGTNSHDRRIGAEAIVRALVESGAIGLVTTHDLALTELASQLGRAAANMHFEDRLENGRMVFDYRMRPGIVEHSNALALMRAIGLDV
jgi:CBS domain-containing protein